MEKENLETNSIEQLFMKHRVSKPTEFDYADLAPRKGWLDSQSEPGNEIKAILFDLDGTLYNQAKFRLYILFDIICYYILHPKRILDIFILQVFRSEIEKHAGQIVSEELEINWTMEKLCTLDSKKAFGIPTYLDFFHIFNLQKISRDRVESVITQWIKQRPLRFLSKSVYPEAREIFSKLRSNSIPFAIVSDYHVNEKMIAMGFLENTADVSVSALDSDVQALKPSPKGFLFAAQKLAVPPANCLVIGDRDSRDGEGARRSGMNYICGLKKFKKYYMS